MEDEDDIIVEGAGTVLDAIGGGLPAAEAILRDRCSDELIPVVLGDVEGGLINADPSLSFGKLDCERLDEATLQAGFEVAQQDADVDAQGAAAPGGSSGSSSNNYVAVGLTQHVALECFRVNSCSDCPEENMYCHFFVWLHSALRHGCEIKCSSLTVWT